MPQLRALPVDGDEHLERVLDCLRNGSNEIFVDPALVPKAIKPLNRMLDFTRAARLKLSGNA